MYTKLKAWHVIEASWKPRGEGPLQIDDDHLAHGQSENVPNKYQTLTD